MGHTCGMHRRIFASIFYILKNNIMAILIFTKIKGCKRKIRKQILAASKVMTVGEEIVYDFCNELCVNHAVSNAIY